MNYEVKCNETDLTKFPLNTDYLQAGLDFLRVGILGGVFQNEGINFFQDSTLYCTNVLTNPYNLSNIISSKNVEFNINFDKDFMFAIFNISNFESVDDIRKLNFITYNENTNGLLKQTFIVYSNGIPTNRIISFNSIFNFFPYIKNDQSEVTPLANDTGKIEGIIFVFKDVS